jgi:hypothetical protein
LDLKGNKWQEAGEDCIFRKFITLNASQIIIRVIKSRRMRWAGYAARTGEVRNAYSFSRKT